jgi:hypothetical protein
VSRQRAAILSGIIINKNLKLLLINYLAQKVDVLSSSCKVTIYLGQNLWQDCVYIRNSSAYNLFELGFLGANV